MLRAIKARLERDPEFRAALFEEAINAFLEGETAVGKALLLDIIHSSIGFEGLAKARFHEHGIDPPMTDFIA